MSVAGGPGMQEARADLPYYREALRRLIRARIDDLLQRPHDPAEMAQLRLDLERIDLPEFGVCAACDASIDFAGLLADPGMRHCRQCGQHYFWEQDANFRFVLRIGTEFEPHPPPPGSVLGKTRWELPALNMTEEDWARHRADLEARREFRDLILVRPNPEGVVRRLSVTGRPVFDDDGRFTGYRGYARELPP